MTILEQRDCLHPDSNPAAISSRMQDIEVFLGSACTMVTADGVYRTRQGQLERLPADSAIPATGLKTSGENWASYLNCAVDTIPSVIVRVGPISIVRSTVASMRRTACNISRKDEEKIPLRGVAPERDFSAPKRPLLVYSKPLISLTRWQATKWLGNISSYWGSVCLQASVAYLQRSAKRQPGFGSMGEETSPVIGTFSRL